jgi:hypothetical protein
MRTRPSPKIFSGRNFVKGLSALGVITVSALILVAALLADDAVAQLKSPQELLVGTWTFVSADSVRNDGSKVAVFGSNPITQRTMP